LSNTVCLEIFTLNLTRKIVMMLVLASFEMDTIYILKDHQTKFTKQFNTVAKFYFKENLKIISTNDICW